jgi:hypothetical protein
MNKSAKIVGYWAKAMLNYRKPEGELALDKLREIVDDETVNAIMFISGFCGGPESTEGLKELARMVEET